MDPNDYYPNHNSMNDINEVPHEEPAAPDGSKRNGMEEFLEDWVDYVYEGAYSTSTDTFPAAK